MAAFSQSAFLTDSFSVQAFDFGDIASAPSTTGGFNTRVYRYVDREELKRLAHAERIALGIIPDDAPPKAIEIIENAVVESVITDEPQPLQYDFEEERQEFKRVYLEYYKSFKSALEEKLKRRRKRLMVFALFE